MAANEVFDSVVVGGGLSGLMVAQMLSRAGQKIRLLESSEVLGGNCRGISTPYGDFDHGIKMLFAQPGLIESITELSRRLAFDIQTELKTQNVITFYKNHFHPFVGFADTAPPFVEQLNYYLTSDYVELKPSIRELIVQLSLRQNQNVKTLQRVSSLVTNGSRVVSVKTDTGSEIHADQFVFCGSPEDILQIVPHGTFSTKASQRLANSEIWSSIHVDFVHSSPVSERPERHLLFGGTENSQPAIGCFSLPESFEGQQVQKSKWLTFVSTELMANEEELASTLKEVKRQIRRAYSNAFDGLMNERILVTKSSHGTLNFKLSEGGRVDSLENLWIIGRGLGTTPNIPGVIQQTLAFSKVFPKLKSFFEHSVDNTSRPPEGIFVDEANPVCYPSSNL